MNEPIVPIAHIERKARDAFERKEPISANPFPWNSAARRTWNEMYRRLQAETQRHGATALATAQGEGI